MAVGLSGNVCWLNYKPLHTKVFVCQLLNFNVTKQFLFSWIQNRCHFNRSLSNTESRPINQDKVDNWRVDGEHASAITVLYVTASWVVGETVLHGDTLPQRESCCRRWPVMYRPWWSTSELKLSLLKGDRTFFPTSDILWDWNTILQCSKWKLIAMSKLRQSLACRRRDPGSHPGYFMYICGGQSGTQPGFSSSSSALLYQNHSTGILHTHISCGEERYALWWPQSRDVVSPLWREQKHEQMRPIEKEV
jgi:hypothetical protein